MSSPGSRTLLRNRGLLLAVAEILVVAVGLMYLTRQKQAGRAEQITLVTPRDAVTVGSLPSRFRWSSLPRSTAYQFSLYRLNRTLIWSALVRDTSIAIPSSVEIPRGQSYLWRVEAILPGDATADSEIHTFTLTQ
jgi:hypothetical protein